MENFQEEELAVKKVFHGFHIEDKLVIESVQQGRQSPVWRQHYYSPFWDSMHHYFNQLMMKDMATDPNSQD
jgi:hypothetical protein